MLTNVLKIFFVTVTFAIPFCLNAQNSNEPYITTFDLKTGRPNTIKDSTTISLIGAADIQKAYSDGKGVPATTGVGALFKRRFEGKKFNDIEVQLTINVASTLDTIKGTYVNNKITNERQFGLSLLQPSVSQQAVQLKFRGYFSNYGSWSKLSGIRFNFIGSNKIWNAGDTSNTSATASILSFSIGTFYELIRPEIRFKNDISITMGANYDLLLLSGDAGIPSRAGTLRNLVIGTDQKSFHGISGIITLRFNNIEAEAWVPFYISKSGIDGFSHGQFVTTIRFVGGIPLLIKK